MKNIEWKLTNGKQVTVTVDIKAVEQTANTGWGTEVATGKYIVLTTVTAEVAGMGVVGTGSPARVPANDRGIVAGIGKLGLTEETYKMVCDAIEAEKAELKNNAGYQAYLAQCAKNRADGEKYEKAHQEILDAMNM
jgi:hypothetical protein